MALWRWVPLYQSTKRVTQRVADARSAKGSRGYAGVCFGVRNSASEYGLSSETCGRLKDGITPSHCKVESIVLPRMALPLSECSTRPPRIDIAFRARPGDECSRDVCRFAFGDVAANNTTAPDVQD